MKNHLKIIIALCNPLPQKQKLSEQLSDINSDIDWKRIIDVSIEHSVLPTVYENLEKYFKNYVSKEHLHKIKELNQQISLSNINKAKELIITSQKLANNDVDFISFKGPLLSISSYGDITKRQYRDIDIMVDKKDFLKTKEILINLGYEPQFNLKNSYQKIYLEKWNYLNFYTNEGFNSLDLHWRSANKQFSFCMEFNELKKNAEEVELFNTKIRTFSLEDNLIYLCQHGCKHGWRKLVWILDIHKLISNSEKINWEILFSKARKYNSIKMFKSGLLISNKLFGTKLPKDIHSKIYSNKNVCDMVLERVNLIFKKELKENNFLYLSSDDLFYLKSMNSVKDKLFHILSFFKPTPLEWRLEIPTSFYFLYYFYRPIRILKKKFLNK